MTRTEYRVLIFTAWLAWTGLMLALVAVASPDAAFRPAVGHVIGVVVVFVSFLVGWLVFRQPAEVDPTESRENR